MTEEMLELLTKAARVLEEQDVPAPHCAYWEGFWYVRDKDGNVTKMTPEEFCGG